MLKTYFFLSFYSGKKVLNNVKKISFENSYMNEESVKKNVGRVLKKVGKVVITSDKQHLQRMWLVCGKTNSD